MHRIQRYHHPSSVDEAVRILAEGGKRAAVIAGGTDIVPHCPSHVEALVDISRLGLDRVELKEDSVEIGACTALQTLVEHVELRGVLDGQLREAAFHSATRYLRNAATVGGVLVSQSPEWDVVAALLATDAQVVMVGPDGSGTVPLDEFLARRDAHLTPGCVITKVRIPRFTSDTHARYERLARCAHDAPIVSAVVRWTTDGGRFSDVRVVVGGVGNRPQRLRLTESALDGRPLHVDEIDRACALIVDHVHAQSDVRASARYRVDMAAVIVRRTLLAAAQPA